jgi:hypothetical protein
MHKHIIGSVDELEVLVQAGEDSFGYYYPETTLEYYNNEIIIGFNSEENIDSEITLSSTRLLSGELRTNNGFEPVFNENAHYLVKISNKEETLQKYHQFDKEGNYLS